MGTNIPSYLTSSSHTACALYSTPTTVAPAPYEGGCLRHRLIGSVCGRAMIVAWQSRLFLALGQTKGWGQSETVRQSQATEVDRLNSDTVMASVLWIMQWIVGFVLVGFDMGRNTAPRLVSRAYVQRPQNRRRRHLDSYAETRASFPLVRRVSTLFRLLMRGKTPGQRQALEARLSVQGHINIYDMPYWGTILLRRAQLVCYDHGWWRAPQTAAVNGGMWDAQLPDN